MRLITFAGPYQRNDYSPIGRILSLEDSPAGLAFASSLTDPLSRAPGYAWMQNL